MSETKKPSFEAEEISKDQLSDSELEDVSGGTCCDSCEPGCEACSATDPNLQM